MPPMEPPPDVREAVVRALEEDRAAADATSLALVPAAARPPRRQHGRAGGGVSGVDHATLAFQLCDPAVELDWLVGEGGRVADGDELLRCAGSARGLLAAERTALNFLQQLSGVATATAELVGLLGGEVKLLDTRKTVPGLRDAQKRAVVAGGGVNHRRDLEDQVLIKENHFALSGLEYGAAVRRAQEASPGKVVGAEAQTEAQAALALEAGADYVLLDNFDFATLPQVVARLRARFPAAQLEVSGGVRPENAAAIRGCGVDRVSVGWITHSSPALDLSFYLEAAG
jgi:nicotinate-nucleotide pyrophosphorylase (carboxylating)